MEVDFNSVYIGENTLAAIEIAENAGKCKHLSINRLNSVNDKNVQEQKSILSKDSPFDIFELEKIGSDHSHRNLVSNIGEGNVIHPLNRSHSEKLGISIYSLCLDEERQVDCKHESVEENRVRCSLGDWDLPTSIIKKYEEMGVKSMFQWQVECLSNHLVLSGKNLIYSAPTSAGKTLVAELLTIKTVIEHKKKAIIILPFVSVVVEKTSHFQSIVEGYGIRVEGFMGGRSPIGGFQRTDIAICTIEKANSLINRLMEDGGLDKLGIVVVDELHLLGDSHRGYLLELLLTKLRYMSARESFTIQIIGMSATLPNLKLLANWLHAELYQTDFRPVPLKEFIKFDRNIYDRDLKLISRVNLHIPIQGDNDDLALLCVETISDGFSVLIFCPTKNWCEKLAETIAKSFYFIGTSDSPSLKADDTIQKFISHLTKSPVTEVLEKLKRSPVGLDPILAKTVAFGVAFHHAGLTMDEREILETSFRLGSLRVLVATSTLSSGVNLPARRVIIRTPLFHGQLLDVLTYRQMIGRAGRMGVDTAGESILVCQEKERRMVERLLTSDLPPIQSCLGGSKVTGSLKRAIFEVIASGVASTPKDIESYANFTLLMAAVKEEAADQLDLRDPLKDCLKYLEENEFIRLTESDGEVKYAATALGEACLAASLPPDQALALFEELQRARRCFVLEDELHIIYQVTPFSVADQWGNNLDWVHMLNIWQLLSPSMQRVGELVGVEERFMVRAMRGSLNIKAPKQLEKMAIHRRFYTALALQELTNEVPLNDVAQKYGCSRGMLQNLQQSAATFAGMVTQFCQRLRWSGLELLASQFQDRLQFGIRRELCDLMRLPMLDGQCARALFDAGIETLAMLAVDAAPEKIEDALRSYVPFQSDKNKKTDSKGTDKVNHMSGGVRYLLGKNAAHSLIEEARKLLQKDLGIAEMKWEKSSKGEKESISLDADVVDHGNQTQIHEQNNKLLSNKSMISTSIVSSSKTENNLNVSSDIMANIDGGDGCIVIENPISYVKSVKTDQNSSSVTVTLDKTIRGVEIVSEVAELSILKSSSFNEGRDFIAVSNGVVPDTPASPDTPTFTSHQSEKSSNSNRRSLDMFSSPVGDTSAKSSFQSPSLFGDSFTIDTQLGGLLDGSPVSDRINNLSNNSLKGLKSSLEKTLKQTDDLKISAEIFPSQSTPTIKPKQLSVVSRLKLEESLKNKTSPYSTPKCFPGKRESLDICAAVGPLTPGEWDFGTVWNIEEDVGSTNLTDVQNDKETLKVDSSKIEDDAYDDDNSNLNRNNLTSNDANNSSLLERIFMATFDIDRNSIVKVNEAEIIDRGINLMDERVEDNDPNEFVDGEGWGNYLHNCSLEAVHHSIISPACNANDLNIDVIMSSDEDEGMILSSQEDNTMNVLSRSKRSVIPKENFRRHSSKLETGCHQTELGAISSEQYLQEKEATVLKPSIKINSENLIRAFNPAEKLISSDLNHPLSEVISLDIIDVCNDVSSFNIFCKELEEEKVFSFSVAVSRFEKNQNKILDVSEVDDGNTTFELSHRITPSKRKRDVSESDIDLTYNSEGFHLNCFIKVDGISFSSSRNKVYFLSLSSCEGNQLKPSYYDKIVFLKNLFESAKRKKTCVAMDMKEHLKALIISCDIIPNWNYRFFDPKIGDWLLNPTAQEKNLSNMCMAYCPELWKVLNRNTNNGQAATVESRVVPKHLSAVESLISLKCMNKLEGILLERNLFSVFSETEMPTALCLAQMEALGIGFSKSQGDNVKSLLLSKMKELENKAYALAGHVFRISSPIEVGKVLYLELRLPVQQHKNFAKTKHKRKWSTSKESLERITSLHLLPRVILEWRKISSIYNKTVHPLLQCTLRDRIYGRHILHTSTGRISMHEPNLQNIPRNFEILSLNSVPIKNDSCLDKGCAQHKETHQAEDNKLSIRHCFLPAKGFVFLSADYSQLELRIMAYLSKDEKLCSILNKGADVFTMIASSWKNIGSKEVLPVLRQQTKKICYGILYGIGCKSLAQQLEVEEKEALNFMETFKYTFPGLNKFLITTVEKCKAVGYVETIAGRRRELPAINSTNPSLRAQAERQAVNTLVQGSAADLVKVAMVRVMKKIKERFPPLGYQSSSHNAKALRCQSPFSKKFHLNDDEGCGRSPAGAVLVLHLHDELLFEVAKPDLGTVAQIVKSQMEAPWEIKIHLPVNLKVGGTWGTLSDY